MPYEELVELHNQIKTVERLILQQSIKLQRMKDHKAQLLLAHNELDRELAAQDGRYNLLAPNDFGNDNQITPRNQFKNIVGNLSIQDKTQLLEVLEA